jgi:hypothetical protein
MFLNTESPTPEERARQENEAESEWPASVIERLLDLEDEVREAAINWPSGPNSDAIKQSVMNAAKGIADIRKARAQLEGYER